MEFLYTGGGDHVFSLTLRIKYIEQQEQGSSWMQLSTGIKLLVFEHLGIDWLDFTSEDDTCSAKRRCELYYVLMSCESFYWEFDS